MSDGKPKHTPGPWTVSDNPDGLPIVSGPKSCTIAHVRDAELEQPVGAWADEIDANAALIAAAPDMLAELKRLEWSGGRYVTTCVSCKRSPHAGHRPACTLAAALRKAEGRT